MSQNQWIKCEVKKSESSVKRAKWQKVRTAYILRCHSTPLLLEIGQIISKLFRELFEVQEVEGLHDRVVEEVSELGQLTREGHA